ncbi:hypothetical protein EDF87_101547 [Pseudomonas helmanticensis]|uniref:Uncharacterized protein n=1 Tax=Pseudomonas helmanticensis TaxID=1471381 RepID=A0A4R7VVJ1_9PSED|nr:hypothetical protein [Pseudomonas helmanticensis]TDV53459.1 hypothetical protein EDF87_101547 [Pseudomonas helmanticensis]
MSKDPHGTVKRLTDALEAAATGVEKHMRLRAVHQELMVLRPEEFPGEYARELFESILEYSGTYEPSRPTAISHPDIDQCFKQLWELYWLMSSNDQYA